MTRTEFLDLLDDLRDWGEQCGYFDDEELPELVLDDNSFTGGDDDE
jgi:hypothetical protein